MGGAFPGGESREYLEQLTLLTYLAGVTKRTRLQREYTELTFSENGISFTPMRFNDVKS